MNETTIRGFYFFIATIFFTDYSMAQSTIALDKIIAKYKICIKTELETSDNGDGTYDEVFFLEGKEHCDKIKKLQIRTAQANERITVSEARISQMTADLVSGAKKELGLK